MKDGSIDKLIFLTSISAIICVIPAVEARSLGWFIYGVSCLGCGALLMLAVEAYDREHRPEPPARPDPVKGERSAPTPAPAPDDGGK